MFIWWRFCPQCEERRQASKKLDLWRLPEVLVIHLKRFSYSRSIKHNKLETFVNFPIHDFDLTNYVANKITSRRQLYELYALTNHYGGMGSGHYTAHIKVSEKALYLFLKDFIIFPPPKISCSLSCKLLWLTLIWVLLYWSLLMSSVFVIMSTYKPLVLHLYGTPLFFCPILACRCG